jgi:threonine/homoserine/homoserine lactone efflux protein
MSWDAFLAGALAGYGIAIPVGAIAVLIVELGLRRGFRPAFAAGAGAATADILYAAIAVWLGLAVSAALSPFAGILRLLSAAVLIGIGAYGIWKAGRRRAQSEPDPSPEVERKSIQVYLQFLGLTLLNPLTVTYFAALILGRAGQAELDFAGKLAFMLGAGLASLSWQSLLAAIGAVGNRHLSPRFQLLASVAGNLLVIGFGVKILLDLL